MPFEMVFATTTGVPTLQTVHVCFLIIARQRLCACRVQGDKREAWGRWIVGELRTEYMIEKYYIFERALKIKITNKQKYLISLLDGLSWRINSYRIQLSWF